MDLNVLPLIVYVLKEASFILYDIPKTSSAFTFQSVISCSVVAMNGSILNNAVCAAHYICQR